VKKFSILSILVCLLIFFDSCKDNPSGSPENQTNWPEGTITLNEVLPNWTYGTGYSLIFCVYPSAKHGYTKTVLDSSAIGNTGNFTIHLPPLASSYHDDSVNFSSVYCFDTVTIFPSSLKTANTVFEIHKDGLIKGALQKKIHKIGNELPGTYYLTYNSFSESANMYGSIKCYTWNGTEFDTTIATVNESVNRGWNTVIEAIVSKSYLKTVYSYYCTDPQLSTEWIYYMNK
jgi:hypothetical protein